MIIAFLGRTVKEYHQNYPVFLKLISLICPICEGNCHNHCWYKRKIQEPELVTIMILRVKCTNCGATHAVLPDFIYPKGRYIEPVREETITGCENERKTQESVSQAQSVKTTQRWIARYREVIRQVNAALQSILARLGVYDIRVTGGQMEQLQELNHRVEKALKPVTSSCQFGKSNILLSWQNMELWI
jgi:predicted transglutaminase-like cysteine proteinase